MITYSLHINPLKEGMRYNQLMQIVQDKISVQELQDMANKMFGNLVKAVVDVEKKILVVDAELHADQEQYLLEQGSHQSELWGINLHPDLYNTDNFVEFDSMINLRPRQNNLSRSITDSVICEKIKLIVATKTTG